MTPLAQISARTAFTRLALIVAGLALAAYLFDALALWMERRGWLYWRKTKRDGGGGGVMAGMLTEMQKIVEPQTEQRLQVMEERRTAAGERAVRGDGIDELGAAATEAGATPSREQHPA
jgi:hypothetical protein